jgi:hypothetical protein
LLIALTPWVFSAEHEVLVLLRPVAPLLQEFAHEGVVVATPLLSLLVWGALKLVRDRSRRKSIERYMVLARPDTTFAEVDADGAYVHMRVGGAGTARTDGDVR